jgi:hypothetical protein
LLISVCHADDEGDAVDGDDTNNDVMEKSDWFSDSHRMAFTDGKGVTLVAAVLQNTTQYPEDCLMEASAILTKLVTKSKYNY